MTNDKLFLKTWEQLVEYKKVKEWGRDWNNTLKDKPAQEIIDLC